MFESKILEDLDIAGIETWNDRGITLRARIKVRALEQSNVKREYLLRLKHAFDKADIQQPRSTVTIMERGCAGASAPEGPATIDSGADPTQACGADPSPPM